jgi:hypothetical protein
MTYLSELKLEEYSFQDVGANVLFFASLPLCNNFIIIRECVVNYYVGCFSK